ncbi:MAG: ATP-binding protein [Kiritimatiellae bacterium]|nr:ATP-binding protein [Kiritimatiellia bacterium]
MSIKKGTIWYLTANSILPSGLSEYQAWNRYLVYGGMPEAANKTSDAARRDYLSGLFKTLYFKDIVEHNNLKNDYVLGLLTDVLFSSIGSLTNPTRIVKTLLTEQGVKPDVHTVQQYLKFLSEAYLFSKAERYDVKGRRYLQYPSKWYAEDVGLRNARLNYRQTERTHLMENIIYNELVARGCNVDVGVVEAKVSGKSGKRELRQYEIDFVVNTGFEKLYIQCALEIPDVGKLSQETFSLRKTRDSFRKLVVVGGDQPLYANDEGISFVGIIPFLLDKTILSTTLSEMR